MSLDNTNRNKILATIDRLNDMVTALLDTSVDPAVLDMLEMTIGLLERQVDMDIEFVSTNNLFSEDSDFLFIDDTADDIVQFAPQSMRPLEDIVAPDEFEPNDTSDVINFTFLNNKKDNSAPSSSELDEWWKLEFPQE